MLTDVGWLAQRGFSRISTTKYVKDEYEVVLSKKSVMVFVLNSDKPFSIATFMRKRDENLWKAFINDMLELGVEYASKQLEENVNNMIRLIQRCK